MLNSSGLQPRSGCNPQMRNPALRGQKKCASGNFLDPGGIVNYFRDGTRVYLRGVVICLKAYFHEIRKIGGVEDYFLLFFERRQIGIYGCCTLIS